MPLSDVILRALAGVFLIGVLMGGGWLYLSHQKKKAEEAAYYAEQDRLFAKREKSLAESREKMEREQLEDERKEEEARLAVIRDSGLTPYQIAARQTYMDMWKRDWSDDTFPKLMKEWYPRIDDLRNNEIAAAELKEISLDPFEIYHLGSHMAEEEKLAAEIEKIDFVGLAIERFGESEASLKEREAKLISETKQDRASGAGLARIKLSKLRELQEKFAEFKNRKSLNGVIIAKWDAAFGLARGKPKTKEQEELILAQVEAARKDAHPSAETEEAFSDYGNTGDVTGAWSYMQLFVEQKLKNPKGAKFPFGGHRSVVNLGNGRYSVRSYVDATNSFGATVRTNFVGVIKSRPGGWDLESLTFE